MKTAQKTRREWWPPWTAKAKAPSGAAERSEGFSYMMPGTCDVHEIKNGRL